MIGEFNDDRRLVLKYNDNIVASLSMEFLHHGRPPVIRQANYQPAPVEPLSVPRKANYGADLKAILGSLNVCSKEWIIRQYDHEVQAGSVVKPLVGVHRDGPSDAALGWMIGGVSALVVSGVVALVVLTREEPAKEYRVRPTMQGL